ncbi:MAG: hypothetical protein AAFX58_02250 [Pseudomonadota bacterium]
MADGRYALTLLAVIGGLGLPAGAAEAPDAEFLEYLGTWDEADDEWLLVDAELTRERASGETVAGEDDDDEDE